MSDLVGEAAVSHLPIESQALLTCILDEYRLPIMGYHGLIHWARVWENGLRIAEQIGVDSEIVKLFALFHDSRRVNESQDLGHGLRGAEFARQLRGSLIHLDNHRFELFFDACRLHTNGLTSGDPTQMACWDADRLDLGRVGIRPEPDRLCTDAARMLLNWAHERAVEGAVPHSVLRQWGFDVNRLPPTD